MPVSLAIFYVSRLVSSQKEGDFVNTNYDDIKRVFSIWICMNMDENCMSYIHLSKDDLIGCHQWSGKLDMLNIVMIGLSNDLPAHDDTYELHRLLGALLSMDLSIDEKLSIIENEYEIELEDSIREDVSVMCNLSQGIKDRTRAEIIVNMFHKGFTLEQIAEATDEEVNDVKTIIENNSAVSV